MRPVERGYCPHGVPWVYHCPDTDHDRHEHHECDTIPRLENMSPEEAAVIRALIAASADAPHPGQKARLTLPPRYRLGCGAALVYGFVRMAFMYFSRSAWSASTSARMAATSVRMAATSWPVA
jgi:hypothetical protein